VTKKNRKVRRLRQLYPEVKVKVLYQRDYMNLLVKYQLEQPSQLVQVVSESDEIRLFSLDPDGGDEPAVGGTGEGPEPRAPLGSLGDAEVTPVDGARRRLAP
jgi:hypothetical protein